MSTSRWGARCAAVEALSAKVAAKDRPWRPQPTAAGWRHVEEHKSNRMFLRFPVSNMVRAWYAWGTRRQGRRPALATEGATTRTRRAGRSKPYPAQCMPRVQQQPLPLHLWCHQHAGIQLRAVQFAAMAISRVGPHCRHPGGGRWTAALGGRHAAAAALIWCQAHMSFPGKATATRGLEQRSCLPSGGRAGGGFRPMAVVGLAGGRLAHSGLAGNS